MKTNRMRLTKGEWLNEWDFVFRDDDTMEIYDDETIDFATGMKLSGEFKDVMVREK